MSSEIYIDIAFALAICLSIVFPLFGVLTTHRFKHRLEKAPKLRRVLFGCIAWMSFVGLIGLTFGWFNGLIRYSGETLDLIAVQQEETKVFKKDIQQSRGSSKKYWITVSTPQQERIEVSRKFYESLEVDHVTSLAHTSFPKVYWPVKDDLSIVRFTNFLFCYCFLIFCSFGFFALAWLPDRSPEVSK